MVGTSAMATRSFSTTGTLREFKIPIGVRFGRVLVKEKGSWNYYFEYQTSAVYKDWPGSAVENSYRFNVTYTIPPF